MMPQPEMSLPSGRQSTGINFGSRGGDPGGGSTGKRPPAKKKATSKKATKKKK